MATPTKQKTAPRKASSPRKKAAVAPESNGQPVQETPELNLDNVPSVLKNPDVEHPYEPGTPVFAYYPKDGSPPIVFPKMITVDISAKFLWRIYELNELYQSFEWMKLAGVPRNIQERVIDLSDEEKMAFWSGWFGEINELRDTLRPTIEGTGPPGESER